LIVVFLKRVFDFYINSNLHVSIAAFCLTKLTLFLYSVDENNIPFFVFFATLISYNFIRFYNIKTIKSNMSVWIKSNKQLLILINFISILFLIKLSFKLKTASYMILTPFIFATFFYSVPFLFKRKSLRNTTGLKLFLIAITWAGVTVLLPLKNAEISFSNDVWIIFVQRFLFLFAITISFDIRDVDFDTPEIKTIPQIFGVRKSKFIGIIALLLFLMMEFLKIAEIKNARMVLLVLTIVSILFLVFSKKKQSKYYSSFWIESLPILWFLLSIYLE